ncbi:MAG: class I SAM-dependent methyltransferase [Mycolicibacterium sp.]|uniref:class I SAM-dependent methyltransferase n=1 Tax=Mycolicibacterium sp. TaxID=2320850 RepID=UPI003D126A8A
MTMPLQIDPAAARELSPRLDEALEIVCNEFDGLDPHRQYVNAFSRVLKPDPLGRVVMLGTDQRDLFIPLLRQAVVDHVPTGGHIFDFGAGDGQTFAHVADAVPAGTTVSLEEPNPVYLAAYQAFLERQPHIRPGAAVSAALDELGRDAAELGEPGSVDLALGMHMMYFATDALGTLEVMLQLVKPGGVFFNVVTDEAAAYVGSVLRVFIEDGGDTGNNDLCLAAVDERRRLLAPPAEGGGGLTEAVEAMGMAVEVESIRQPSRMYGNTLADLLALSNIGVLTDVPGTQKFEAAAKTLRERCEEVDLRIETDGPRMGMWSVTQPQWVTKVRRIR